MEYAEVKLGDQWQLIAIKDAVKYRGKRTRCIDCHGQVYAMGDYTQLGCPRFTHRRSFSGCGSSRGGVALRHPDVVT